MAVTSGTVHSVETIKANDRDPLQAAVVYFTLSGTYAQADNSILSGVPTLIQNSRRNGKTVTMKAVSLFQPARRELNPANYLAAKTIAISTNDITFELTKSATDNNIDVATEFDDATAVPAMSTPLGFYVAFTEA